MCTEPSANDLNQSPHPAPARPVRLFASQVYLNRADRKASTLAPRSHHDLPRRGFKQLAHLWPRTARGGAGLRPERAEPAGRPRAAAAAAWRVAYPPTLGGALRDTEGGSDDESTGGRLVLLAGR